MPSPDPNWRHGFLLTQEWRDTAGGCIATYWGRGDDGVFALRTTVRPVLFVAQGLALPEDLPIAERRSVALKSFQRHPVEALYFLRQRDLLAARDRLRVAGISIYEGDLSPSERFLMERFIHASCAYAGTVRTEPRYTLVDQPRLQHADFQPRLARLAFDIETGSAGQLHAISVHYQEAGLQVRQVFVAATGRRHKDSPAHYCGDAAGALRAFLETVQRLDPDLLCGWNIVGFDLPFLAEVANANGMSLALGRDGSPLRFLDSGSRKLALISGRVVVDGIPALRESFFHFDDYRLETVSRSVLGEGKLLGFEHADKQEEIDRLFREDPERLAAYNLRDAELVNAIFDKLGLVDLLISRSLVSGMLLERLGRSVAAFDHFFLPRLHRKGFVAPDRDAVAAGEALPGGLVLPSQPGLHPHVAIFDFRSLYPSIIRTFKICPYAHVLAGVAPVRTPTGAVFSSTEHILPDYIEELMAVRARARAEGRRELAQAVKILMNSFYGVMGTTGSRFYDPLLSTSITGTGQWVLRTARAILENTGHRVLYGDTDSLFVQLLPEEQATPHAAAQRLADSANALLSERLRADYAVQSGLELEFQRYCRQLYLPSARTVHAAHVEDADAEDQPEGAAKRYAGLVVQPDGSAELLVTGLECVRSDWTPLARRIQRELLERVFREQPYEDWLRGQVADLRAGRLDRELAYRRRLRKPTSAYTHSQPPHVKAAMLLPPDRRHGGTVSYVVTRRGPVPDELPHPDVDHDHYVDKQVRPVVDDILAMKDRDFEAVVTGVEQLRLL